MKILCKQRRQKTEKEIIWRRKVNFDVNRPTHPVIKEQSTFLTVRRQSFVIAYRATKTCDCINHRNAVRRARDINKRLEGQLYHQIIFFCQLCYLFNLVFGLCARFFTMDWLEILVVVCKHCIKFVTHMT